jgi:uncharacterized protein
VQVASAPNLAAIRRALAEGGNRNVTVGKMPGLNHFFQTARTGAMSEYGRLEETFAPAALARVSDWILRQPGGQPPRGARSARRIP